MQVGFKLIAEGYGPGELVRQAVEAERAGFDFVEISDHFHPWLTEDQGHSPFAWSVLAAIAAKTTTLRLVTGVTCPSFRYHPAIIAQAAATTALLSDGRFTLGVGSGERLNEHIIGGGWPAVPVRHARLREALEIIRLLWSGGMHTYDGRYLQIADARVWDLPETLPAICVAISGPKSAQLAADLGDGIFATEPKPELVQQFTNAGGAAAGPKYVEVPLAWAESEDAAVDSAHRLFRFGLLDWKVLPELPNPVNFESAASLVTKEMVREGFGAGPDVERHLETAQPFVDAGFDQLVLTNAGPDQDGFFRFFADQLAKPLRALTRSA